MVFRGAFSVARPKGTEDYSIRHSSPGTRLPNPFAVVATAGSRAAKVAICLMVEGRVFLSASEFSDDHLFI